MKDEEMFCAVVFSSLLLTLSLILIFIIYQHNRSHVVLLSGDVKALGELYGAVFADKELFFQLFGDNSFEFSHKIVDYTNEENRPSRFLGLQYRNLVSYYIIHQKY